MASVYTAVLGFKIFLSAVRSQKIDDSFFKIFAIVIASFQVIDKFEKISFF